MFLAAVTWDSIIGWAEVGGTKTKTCIMCRGKMVQNAREKALQLERKRKAAQFLAQLAEKRSV